MGPIAALWARTMCDRGHTVEVVTGHPHYPGRLWGRPRRPYREVRDGIRITRLPLWIGHASGAQRIREEMTYAASAALVAPFAGEADAIVAVSPSFLGLFPVIVNARLRRTPWILWLQDILPDGASTTGLLESVTALRAARSLEQTVYRAASSIVVISDTFAENLRGKGVPDAKLTRIYNPATRGFSDPLKSSRFRPSSILYMGNIGFSQGLVEVVRAFEASNGEFRLIITGTGELEAAVRAEAKSDRVAVLGLVPAERLERELARASLALVSQRPDVEEFNVPSRLMTLMARGIPILASVRPGSEVARLVASSGGGWVTPADHPEEAADLAPQILRNPSELERRGAAAAAFAEQHFSPDALGMDFERLLLSLVGDSN